MNNAFKSKMSRLRDSTFQGMNEYIVKITTEMESLWLQLYGENEDIFVERYQTIEQHTRELFEEMINEETENYNKRKKVLIMLTEMSKELSQELSVNIEIPHVEVDGINLRQQIKDVQASLEEFKKMKEDRLSILKKYKEEEEKVCEKLGEISKYTRFNSVPSEAKLKEIKSRIVSLNSEKTKRMKSFRNMVSEIQDIIAQLEIEKELSYSQTSLLQNQEGFILSQDNLQELLDWKKELIEQKEAQENMIESLKDKVMALWNRIDVPSEERERIIVKTMNRTCGKTIVKIWNDELDRCEHLKIANIKEVITRIRQNISRLWDDCHIDENERSKFTDFSSDDFNEELLESHEREESKLSQFYEETRELYASAEKWFNLWNKMLALEDRSNNAQRLNNRGGQLLKEEKERKAVQKELPKIESKLEKLIAKFENSHNKPFLYEGFPLMDLISRYWDERRREKENEKETRKIQNQTSRVTPLKVQNRIVVHTPASSNRKRVRPVTPMESEAKRGTLKRELKMPIVKSTKQVRRRSKSHDPNGRYEHRILRSNSANSSVVSYTGFQSDIENRSKTIVYGMPPRSSVSPTHYGFGVTPKNTTPYFKTPTSAVKSTTKRTRLNNFGCSKIIKPMIN